MASPQAVRLFEQIYAKVDAQVRDIVSSMLPNVSVAAQDDGSVIANQHRILNFQGEGVTVNEDPALRRVNVFVPGAPAASSATTVVSSTSAKAHSLWGTGTGSSAAYDAAVLADSPWGYWKMEDPSGTTMLDSSGNTRHGTYDSAVVPTAGPFSGWGAALFSGGGAQSPVVPTSTTAIAFDGWWKLNLAGSFSSMCFHSANPADGTGVWLGAEQVGGCARKSAFALNNPNYGWVCGKDNDLDAVYHYVALSHDADNHWRLYVRGPSGFSQDTDFGAASNSLTGSPKIYFGKAFVYGEPFHGAISHVAFYDHSLTPTRVQAHFDAAAGGGSTGNSAPPANWDQPSYSDSAWSAAVVTTTDTGDVVPSGTSPIWATATPASNSEEVLFRHTFSLAAGTIASATIEVAANDVLADNLTHVNGSTIATTVTVGVPRTFNVPPSLLLPGASNLLAFWVKNVNPTKAWGAWKLTLNYVSAGTDTRYQLLSEKNQANGYAGLDSGTRVPTARLGSGTADSTTFLRGDQTWAAGGSGMTNPMTTQDDIIVGGSSGTPARLAKGSDSQVLTIDPSSHHVAWATPSGGGGSSSGYTAPPLLSTWTWVNQGTATAADSTVAGSGAIYMRAPQAAGGTNVRALVRSLPGGNYTITAGFCPFLSTQGTSNGAGILLRNSSTGAIVVHWLMVSAGASIYYGQKLNSATSYSGDYEIINPVPGFNLSSPFWFRIQDNGTNRIFSVATDGVNFEALHTIGRTDFTTPDQMGFGAQAPASTTAMTLVSWAVT